MAKCFGVFGAVLLSSVFAATAHADSVQVTSGTATVLAGGGGTFLSFMVTEGDSSASGSWDFGAVDFLHTCAAPCAPGALVTLSSTATNDSLLPATAGELGAGAMISTNGEARNGGRVVELLGTLAFSTPAVPLPAAAPGAAAVTLTAPFTLTGTVRGYNPFATDPALLFTTDLAGAGLATMSLPFNASSKTFSSFGTLRYDFQAVTPTPEPLPLLLLATGLAAILAPRIRRLS